MIEKCNVDIQRQDEILAQILSIAYDMLVAGSEVGRVERKMEQMCIAFGMEEVEVFVITSSIVVSVRGNDGRRYTQTKRIRSYQIDFWKLQLLENLVDKICACSVSVKEIEMERYYIERMLQEKRNANTWIKKYVIFSGICAFFTLFFGGSVRDGICSFFSGLFMKSVLEHLEDIVKNKFAMNIVAAVVSGLAACIFYNIGIADSVDKVIIGNIMLLIPGLAMVNAMKDFIGGDMLTGLLRFADAMIQAVAVAIGFALVLLPMGV